MTRLDALRASEARHRREARERRQAQAQGDKKMTQLDADTIRIITRLAELSAQINDLNSEAESLKAELRNLSPGDYDHNGATVLRIIPNRRFDLAAAAGLLDEAVRSECLKVDYDPAKVKHHLTSAQVDACMVAAGKPKVVLA